MNKAEFRARLEHTAHVMLDKIDLVLAILNPPPRPAGPLARAEAGIWRWTNDQFGFCRLCAKPACRRARACRGEPRACLTRHLPQVPRHARDRVRKSLRAQFKPEPYGNLASPLPLWERVPERSEGG
jgi:hypothetical protein